MEGETEGRERRTKPSTWFIHKQSDGRKEGQGHNISTGRVEGSIYDSTEGKKGRAMGVQAKALVEGRTAAKAGDRGKEEE